MGGFLEPYIFKFDLQKPAKPAKVAKVCQYNQQNHGDAEKPKIAKPLLNPAKVAKVFAPKTDTKGNIGVSADGSTGLATELATELPKERLPDTPTFTPVATHQIGRYCYNCRWWRDTPVEQRKNISDWMIGTCAITRQIVRFSSVACA